MFQSQSLHYMPIKNVKNATLVQRSSMLYVIATENTNITIVMSLISRNQNLRQNKATCCQINQ